MYRAAAFEKWYLVGAPTLSYNTLKFPSFGGVGPDKE